MQVGLMAPQGWKGEYDGWRATDAWTRTIELAQQAEALGFEIRDHGAGLFPGGSLSTAVASLAGCLGGPAGFISDALFDQGKIILRQFGGGRHIGGDFEVRIPFPGLFKQSFLACVQASISSGVL